MRWCVFVSLACWLFVAAVVLGTCDWKKVRCAQDMRTACISSTKMEVKKMMKMGGGTSATGASSSIPWRSIGAGAQTLGSMAFSAWSAKKAYERSATSYKNRYQWMMDDLRKAGLNPMLAVGGAQMGSGVSAPMASASGLPNVALTAAQVELVRAQADKTRQEAAILGPKVPTAEVLEKWIRKVLGAVEPIATSAVETAEKEIKLSPRSLGPAGSSAKGVSESTAPGFTSGSSGSVNMEVLKRQPWFQRWVNDYNERAEKVRKEKKK